MAVFSYNPYKDSNNVPRQPKLGKPQKKTLNGSAIEALQKKSQPPPLLLMALPLKK